MPAIRNTRVEPKGTKQIARESAKKLYGLTDDDFAEIDPSCHEEATPESPEVIKYTLWDVLQLKASRKLNARFDEIITLTQATQKYRVSSEVLRYYVRLVATMPNSVIGDGTRIWYFREAEILAKVPNVRPDKEQEPIPPSPPPMQTRARARRGA